jgi:hypothetical protein
MMETKERAAHLPLYNHVMRGGPIQLWCQSLDIEFWRFGRGAEYFESSIHISHFDTRSKGKRINGNAGIILRVEEKYLNFPHFVHIRSWTCWGRGRVVIGIAFRIITSTTRNYAVLSPSYRSVTCATAHPDMYMLRILSLY